MNRVTSLISFFEHFTVLPAVRTHCQGQTTACTVGFSFIPIVFLLTKAVIRYLEWGHVKGRTFCLPADSCASKSRATMQLDKSSSRYIYVGFLSPRPCTACSTFWEIDVIIISTFGSRPTYIAVVVLLQFHRVHILLSGYLFAIHVLNHSLSDPLCCQICNTWTITYLWLRQMDQLIYCRSRLCVSRSVISLCDFWHCHSKGSPESDQN